MGSDCPRSDAQKTKRFYGDDIAVKICDLCPAHSILSLCLCCSSLALCTFLAQVCEQFLTDQSLGGIDTCILSLTIITAITVLILILVNFPASQLNQLASHYRCLFGLSSRECGGDQLTPEEAYIIITASQLPIRGPNLCSSALDLSALLILCNVLFPFAKCSIHSVNQ